MLSDHNIRLRLLRTVDGPDTYCAFCAVFFHSGLTNFDHGGFEYTLEDTEPQDVEWLEELKCLGRNPEIKRPNCFLSGPGHDEGYVSVLLGLRVAIRAYSQSVLQGSVWVSRGHDPNFPFRTQVNRLGKDDASLWVFGSYTTFDNGVEPVFPFHPACLQTFQHALRFESGIEPDDLDKDALYAAMETLNTKGQHALSIDYGELESCKFDRHFYFYPGIEPWTMNPLRASEEIKRYCDSLPKLNPSDYAQPSVSRASNVRDPFKKLPAELIVRLLDFLCQTDIFSFRLASRMVASTPLGNYTWRRVMLQDMPWLCGTFPQLDKAVDYRRVYKSMRLASRGTVPEFIPGLANRRRIWNACLPIVSLYLAKIAHQK